MSNFLKKGKKESEAFNRTKVKRHVKSFYSILNRLEVVANKLRESGEEITEENIEEKSSKILGRNIDSQEKFILLGKLWSHEKQSNS